MFDTVTGMTPEEETKVLADAEARGLTVTQAPDGAWTAVGDDVPPPRFVSRQYALTWLSNRILAIDLAKREAHPSSGLAARYGKKRYR